MFLSRLFVSFAYWIDAKEHYASFKAWTEDILNGKNSSKKVYFDFFMIFLVLSTVGIIIYEAKRPVPPWMYTYETVAIIIFILEWFGRLWTYNSISKDIIEYHEKRLSLAMPLEFGKMLKIILYKKFQYIFSPMSIIDLLAILPYYRPLRILRFFMLFRIFKLMRYANSVSSLFSVFKEKKFELMVLVTLSTFVILASSSIMYIFEGLGDNPNLNTFFDAVYWTAVTMSTLGYGDIVPTTVPGRIVTMLLMAGGLTVVVFATSIVTSAFSEKLTVLRDDRIKEEARKIKDSIVIFGYGRMGDSLATRLKAIKQRFVVVDKDHQKIEDARNKGHLAYEGDITNFDDIEELILHQNVSAVAILTDSDSTNLAVLLGIKAVKPKLSAIVRANSKENIKKYEIAQANHIVFPHEFVAKEAVQYINSPAIFDTIDTIFMQRKGIKMDEVEIPKNSSWVNKSIKELDLKALRLTLIGLFRDKEEELIFKPNQESFLLQGKDILVIVGFKEQIDILAKRLRKI